ncbi:MAG: hypothetical protein ABI240_11695 [Sphingomonas sp.]
MDGAPQRFDGANMIPGGGAGIAKIVPAFEVIGRARYYLFVGLNRLFKSLKRLSEEAPIAGDTQRRVRVCEIAAADFKSTAIVAGFNQHCDQIAGDRDVFRPMLMSLSQMGDCAISVTRTGFQHAQKRIQRDDIAPLRKRRLSQRTRARDIACACGANCPPQDVSCFGIEHGIACHLVFLDRTAAPMQSRTQSRRRSDKKRGGRSKDRRPRDDVKSSYQKLSDTAA